MGKITYDNKVTLVNQPDVANENKVTASDMNEIKTIVNGNDDNFSHISTYSTSETATDMTWIDGKPIYRMVIQTTSPSDKGTWSVVGSITNIGTIINLYGFLLHPNNRIMPINYAEPSYEICTTILGDDIEMMVFNNAWKSRTCYIVAEYTKSS